MHRTTRSARRVMLVPVLLLCLMIAGSAPAAAYTPPNETQTGQVGPDEFRDGTAPPAVHCAYRKVNDNLYKIKHFKVRAPRVWWPDTNADKDDQHGVVGWRFKIQKTSDPDDQPWSTVYTSGIQKRTAYEGAYDNSFKASFTTRGADWSGNGKLYLRVRATVYWFKGNGTVRGSKTHWYQYYDADYGATPMNGYCLNRITFA